MDTVDLQFGVSNFTGRKYYLADGYSMHGRV